MDHSTNTPQDEDKASPSRPVSIKRIRKGETELDQRARQVGSAAGAMVALLRDARHQFNQSDLWKTTNPLSDLRPTAKGRARELKHAAALRAQEWRQAALERISQMQQQTKVGHDPAHSRHNSERGNPLLVVAAAGVIGFLLGTGLKAWNSRRIR